MMAGKRLGLIKEAIPRAARIAVPAVTEAGSRRQLQWTEKAALTLGVKGLITPEIGSRRR